MSTIWTSSNKKASFPLFIQSSGEAMTTIGYLTKDELSQEGIAFVDNIKKKKYVTYGYLHSYFVPIETIETIIGRKGYYLIMTTSISGADFIWHDRAKNMFMFWGERASVIKAMYAIRKRILKYAFHVAAAADAADAAAADAELDDELAYYQKKEEIESYREPEHPTYNLNIRTNENEEILSKYNYRKKAAIHWLEVNPDLLEYVCDFNDAGVTFPLSLLNRKCRSNCDICC
jgi:hypothetical protein